MTMLKALCYSLLIRQPPRISNSMSSSTRRFMSSTVVDPLLLAQDWSQQLLSVEQTTGTQSSNAVIQATRRSLPLLEDASSVPFVCRYRTDVISPLTTQQVFLLHSLKQKHDALASLREKLLACYNDDEVKRRIQTSTSKSELEDLYAPFKPPSKGSILERIQNEHPELVERVDAIWNSQEIAPPAKNLKPRDAVIHLVAHKIASEPKVVDIVMEELVKHCRIKTTMTDQDVENKYRTYHDFSSSLVRLKDFQVLAIRRGVTQKAIKMSYDVDGTKMIKSIKWQIYKLHPWISKSSGWNSLIEEAIQDAWTRLLRRRGTTRLWSDKQKEAQERAMFVFEENLRHALLAPPLAKPTHILAVDPGYKAGNKCVILDPNGKVIQLETVVYLGNKRENAAKQFGELLETVKRMMNNDDEKVVVALGNGSGSQETRTLLHEVSQQYDIPIDIHLVNEAGASVWSVTQAAKQEFPDHPPAAIASISIGRRLLNPLHDLIKVPPKSLGLGMYQHDLSEKELDEKLHLVSVDAVATVGVDVNACSLEILQKVPGLTKLASKIVKARPLETRNNLLDVSGLGPKSFENCAAFCRVEQGSEALDATLVHPESYHIARWLLKHFDWDLSSAPSDIPPRKEWHSVWSSDIKEASDKFGVSQERVLAVIENLVDSMSGIDPRLRNAEIKSTASTAGSLDGCTLLSPDLASSESALQEACPVRGVVGTIRNIADFGVFVDFGGHSDGLVHTSGLGPVDLRSLLIGQQIGVDVLSAENGRVSLGLAGLNLTAERRPPPRSASGKASTTGAQRRNNSSYSKRSGNGSSSSKRSGSNKGSNTSNKRRKTTR